MWPRVRAAIISSSLAMMPSPVCAQDPEPVSGLLREPPILTKIARSADTLTSGGPRDEFYVDTDNMITGEGWISAGPGYRRNVLGGLGRIDVSTVISWNLYQSAQASFEFPHLLRDRLSLGTQARYQDVLQVRYFGPGNGSTKSEESTTWIASMGARTTRMDGVFGRGRRRGRALLLDAGPRRQKHAARVRQLPLP